MRKRVILAAILGLATMVVLMSGLCIRYSRVASDHHIERQLWSRGCQTVRKCETTPIGVKPDVGFPWQRLIFPDPIRCVIVTGVKPDSETGQEIASMVLSLSNTSQIKFLGQEAEGKVSRRAGKK